MKKLLVIFSLVACALGGRAATYNITTLTITSAPPPLATVTFNGNTRTWSNQESATLILTNGNVNFCATNLFNALVDYPLANPRPNLTWENTNAIGLRASPMVISVSPGWATITSSSSNQLPGVAYTVPIDSLYATNRTNNASDVAYGLSKYSTNALDGITVTNAKSINGTVNRLTNGVYQTPTLQTPTITGGVADGLRPTNVVALHGTNSLLYGGTIDSAINTNSVNTNIAWMNGNVGGTLNGGTYDGGRITNAIGINGTVNRLTNGYQTNGIYDKAIATNLTVYNGLSSYGTNAAGAVITSSFRAGAGADATNNFSMAIGNGALAGGVSSLAIGSAAVATNDNTTSIGQASYAANGGTALGSQASATGINSAAFGGSASTTHQNSTAIGTKAVTSTSNQIVIGHSPEGVLVTVPGRIEANSITNGTFTGSVTNKGDWSDVPLTITSLANGNNVLNPGNATVIRLAAGPTAAFSINSIQGVRDGRPVEVWNDTGQALTVAHESGFDATNVNRIITSGADVVFGTNVYLRFRYFADRSRWKLSGSRE